MKQTKDVKNCGHIICIELGVLLGGIISLQNLIYLETYSYCNDLLIIGSSLLSKCLSSSKSFMQNLNNKMTVRKQQYY